MSKVADLKTPFSGLEAQVTIAPPTKAVPKSVRWSFFLFISSLPLETLDIPYITSGTMTLSRLCGVIFFALYLLYTGFPLRFNFPRIPTALWFFLLYFVVYLTTGLFVEDDSLRAYVVRIMTLVQLFALLWLVSDLCRDLDLAKKCLMGFSIACTIVAVGTLLHLPGFVEVHGSRVSAFGFSPNEIGPLMAYAALIILSICLNERTWSAGRKLTFAALVLPLMIVLISTGSRSAVGAFILGVLVLLLPQGRSRRGLIALFVPLVALAGFLYLARSDSATTERFARTFQEGETAGRQEIYGAAAELIAEKPMFGWGGRDAFTELALRTGRLHSGLDAHNLVLYLLLEVGLLGALPFLVAVCLCVVGAWRARRTELGLLCLALLTTMLAHAMFHTSIRVKFFWLILGLSLAAASAAKASNYRVRIPWSALRISRERPAGYQSVGKNV